MRLSDLLSNPPSKLYVQVDGFLQNKKGNCGQNVKLSVGHLRLNYFCQDCDDLRTFYSKSDLSAIFVNKRLISIDSVITCAGCGMGIPVWFLVESKTDITGQAPELRILKKSEKLLKSIRVSSSRFDEFANLLDKAEQAYNEELGAGAIVYLRKVFEKVTIQSANAINIEYDKYENGNPKNFFNLLTKVDKECAIIPKEFAKNGYKLFKELSNVVHGEYDENIGLSKFEPLYRLVVGILESIKNHKELVEAIEKLDWKIDKGEEYDKDR